MSSTSRLRSTPTRLPALAAGIAVAAALALASGPTPPAGAMPPFDLTTVTGVTYGGSQGTALDLYVPDFPGNARLPLLIWTDGCAWLFPCGTNRAAAIAAEFNPRGYAVTSSSSSTSR